MIKKAYFTKVDFHSFIAHYNHACCNTIDSETKNFFLPSFFRIQSSSLFVESVFLFCLDLIVFRLDHYRLMSLLSKFKTRHGVSLPFYFYCIRACLALLCVFLRLFWKVLSFFSKIPIFHRILYKLSVSSFRTPLFFNLCN